MKILEYFSWQGQIGRLRFLVSSVLTSLIALFISLGMMSFSLRYVQMLPAKIINELNGPALFGGTMITAFAVFAILLLFFLSFPFAKRFHDLNKSGWYYLIMLVPFLNIYFFLELAFRAGQSNEYRTDFFNRLGDNLVAKLIVTFLITVLWLLSLSR